MNEKEEQTKPWPPTVGEQFYYPPMGTHGISYHLVEKNITVYLCGHPPQGCIPSLLEEGQRLTNPKIEIRELLKKNDDPWGISNEQVFDDERPFAQRGDAIVIWAHDNREILWVWQYV